MDGDPTTAGGGAPRSLTHRLLEPKVEASYPEQEPWLPDHCASGLYILILLLEGYKFSEETWPNIQFQKQVTALRTSACVGQGENGTGPRTVTQQPSRAMCLPGRWHRHRLDTGLHAEPDRHDSSRGTDPVAGSELQHLDGWSSVRSADPCGHSWGSCRPALLDPGLEDQAGVDCSRQRLKQEQCGESMVTTQLFALSTL